MVTERDFMNIARDLLEERLSGRGGQESTSAEELDGDLSELSGSFNDVDDALEELSQPEDAGEDERGDRRPSQ